MTALNQEIIRSKLWTYVLISDVYLLKFSHNNKNAYRSDGEDTSSIKGMRC